MEEDENNEVYQWLIQLGLTEYFNNFKEAGFTDFSYFKYFKSEEQMASILSISRFAHRCKLWENLQLVQRQFSTNNTPTIRSISPPSIQNNTQMVGQSDQQLKKLTQFPKQCKKCSSMFTDSANIVGACKKHSSDSPVRIHIFSV
eukprot:TRINITY_DN123_c0_g1_i1.p1 TRINITY_DN123_c0_g1~~TRINITY_DN123_c0_g1_i1.p1  ORF type:complete len:145 (-),score=17.35 TRINITY_DN123_c0_g1_i1:62-496(-)